MPYRDLLAKLCDKTLPNALASMAKQLICGSVKAHKNSHKWEKCIMSEPFVTVIDTVLKLSMSVHILASKN